MSKSVTFVIASILVAGVACYWAIHSGMQGSASISSAAAGETSPAPKAGLRLGIIPERDVFQQRKAYRLLGDYLASKNVAAGPVEISTSSSYAGALQDMQEGQIDAAFVGSLVAVLAYDRCQAQVLLKSETLGGRDTYSGVVFVREDSPARSFVDLLGKRIGGVKTTTAGAVYPLFLIRQLGWEAHDVPALVWAGTHDEVLAEVAAGHLDAGAVKDSRYDAYVAAHPEARLRKLCESSRVPNNALIVRKDMPAAQRARLVQVLLDMPADPAAAETLQALEIRRFTRCDIAEYAPLYDMIEKIGPMWFAMEAGTAPRRPAATEGGI